MSEQAPTPRPVPRPPKENMETIAARLARNLGVEESIPPAPSAPRPRPQRESADVILERLETNLAVLEAKRASTPDTAQPAPTSTAAEVVAPVAEAPVVEATAIDTTTAPIEAATDPAPEAPQAPDDSDAIAELEKMFAGPEASTVPARGELTHHDYHAQRPSEGVYRSGKGFKHTAGSSDGGKFASREEYENQTGIKQYPNGPDGVEASAAKYYDIMGLNEVQPDTSERPSYETMNTDELVFAYARAELVGDKFVTDDIRNVYTTAMEEAYTDPSSPITYEEHMAALERFDRMAEAAIAYEKAKDPDHFALVDAAVERANKEPSIGDKLKKWWAKSAESAKKLFRPEFWGERWTALTLKAGEAANWALNLGVDKDDSPEEAERKRKRNRVVYIAGAVAVTVAGVATIAYGVGYSVGSGSNAEAADAAMAGGLGTGAGDILSPEQQAAADALTPQTGSEGVYTSVNAAEANAPDASVYPSINAIEADAAAEAAADVVVGPEPLALTDPSFTIESGDGGYRLFERLNIDAAKWNENKDFLLAQYPNNFYDMGDGAVGINERPLTDEIKTFLNTLRA